MLLFGIQQSCTLDLSNFSCTNDSNPRISPVSRNTDLTHCCTNSVLQLSLVPAAPLPKSCSVSYLNALDKFIINSFSCESRATLLIHL